MNYRATRGWLNNNHLNIRRTNSHWNGMAQVQNDKSFCVFISPAWGYRAAIKILLGYHAKLPVYNLLAILSRWAPASDGNRPRIYADIVAKHANIDVLQPIPTPLQDKELWVKILSAMCHVETGCPYDKIPIDDISKSFTLL